MEFIADSTKSVFIQVGYSDAYILVRGNKAIEGGSANTRVEFKNCIPFKTCRTEMSDVFVDNALYIYNAMQMYNLIEYSGNYSDTPGSLSQFKRSTLV